MLLRIWKDFRSLCKRLFSTSSEVSSCQWYFLLSHSPGTASLAVCTITSPMSVEQEAAACSCGHMCPSQAVCVRSIELQFAVLITSSKMLYAFYPVSFTATDKFDILIKWFFPLYFDFIIWDSRMMLSLLTVDFFNTTLGNFSSSWDCILKLSGLIY